MTTHVPRPYQARVIAEAHQAWSNVDNVLIVMPTGAGKSYTLARIVEERRAPTVVIAHRAELVSQLSVALAREGIRHRVVGPEALRRVCVQMQMDDCGRSYYDPNAPVAVASVDTLIRLPESDPWVRSVRLWVCDEAHHVAYEGSGKPNKWARATELFPQAKGLGVTATPLRLDGRGLGRPADGVFDKMIVGPTMRELIHAGYLSDYRVVSAPSDLDLSQVSVSASGDFSPPKLSAARRRSRITGDVVREYLRHAQGKLGVTFDVDIESATGTADAFRAAGVPAEVVSSKTPDALRASIMRRFKERRILQVVNVDLLGEGVDVPAIEVVSMARPTQSYGLYVQMFGRSLRPLEGKGKALILDHVGNVMRHGLPDARQRWTLDRRERSARKGPSDAIPTRTCLNEQCFSVYERLLDVCPFCGTPAPPPAGRSAPEQVDGDLVELSPEVLARLRGEIAAVDGSPVYPRTHDMAILGAVRKRHEATQVEQAGLRGAMATWGGVQHAQQGLDTRQQQKLFYWRFGLDVASAQALNAREAVELRERVEKDMRV
jgi:DNA repair protein RadD